jgi:Transglycosylase SLT domain
MVFKIISARENYYMNTLRPAIPAIILSLCLLPGVAAARPSVSRIPYFDSLYSYNRGADRQSPGASASPAHVPDPKSAQVQVFIFKKATVIWNQPVPGLPLLSPGTVPSGPRILVKDRQTDQLIQKYAKKQGVDPKLVQAMIRQESGFNPLAVSPKGAMGLMQLMPETAASLGVEDPFNVEQNIRGGIQFLKGCLNRFDQNLPLALAAYNAGPGRVVEHQGMPPFKETQTYVKKIVQEYCGQTLDPSQIKLVQPAETKVAETQPGHPAQPQNQAASPPSLDLTTFANTPEQMGSFLFSEKTALKKRAQVSIF